MAKHRARTHKWVDGILSISEQIFDTFDQAVMWAYSFGAHNIKVYDEEGQVLHAGTTIEGATAESYAGGLTYSGMYA
jgi:hypothetical protein